MNQDRRTRDHFGARATLRTLGGSVIYYRLGRLADATGVDLSRLPYSIRVLLEAVLREGDGDTITSRDAENLARWDPAHYVAHELPFKPARVLLQDFTGVPAVVDLAALRSAMNRLGGDPGRINPQIPVDLVIDHSVQVDRFGSRFALLFNAEREFERNRERYEFLRWGQTALDNFRVVPPATGIVHQVNLEYLARVVQTRQQDGERGRIARFAGGDRFSHHHDQRAGRPWLGCGRHRSRGGDVGPTHLYADAPGGRLSVDRRIARGRDRH